MKISPDHQVSAYKDQSGKFGNPIQMLSTLYLLTPSSHKGKVDHPILPLQNELPGLLLDKFGLPYRSLIDTLPLKMCVIILTSR